jgi:hypothetical protein
MILSRPGDHVVARTELTRTVLPMLNTEPVANYRSAQLAAALDDLIAGAVVSLATATFELITTSPHTAVSAASRTGKSFGTTHLGADPVPP